MDSLPRRNGAGYPLKGRESFEKDKDVLITINIMLKIMNKSIASVRD
jgi:hypothetical protein